MIYKLLAVNIDGTLLQSNGRYSKATKEAIEYVHSKGVSIVLVTSRSYQLCEQIVKTLKLQPMIVASQGAFIGTTIDQPLLITKVHEQTALDIIKLLEQLQCQIILHCEEMQIANRIHLPENLIGKVVMYANEQKMHTHRFVDCLSDYLQNEPANPFSLEAKLHTKKEQEDIKKVIESTFSDVRVICKSDHTIIVVPTSVSKWKGIQQLAEHYKISVKEIVAIGDAEDDVESIVGAGMGVAMGNASLEIRKKADWITRSNNDDGVAYMVKELFRKQYQLEFLEKMNLLK